MIAGVFAYPANPNVLVQTSRSAALANTMEFALCVAISAAYGNSLMLIISGYFEGTVGSIISKS